MTINLPATCIMLLAWGQALVVVPSGHAPWLVMYLSAALGILGWPLGWGYRSVMTPRWKLWAYSGAQRPGDESRRHRGQGHRCRQ